MYLRSSIRSSSSGRFSHICKTLVDADAPRIECSRVVVSRARPRPDLEHLHLICQSASGDDVDLLVDELVDPQRAQFTTEA